MRFPRPRKAKAPPTPSIGSLVRAPLIALVVLLILLAANIATAYLNLGGGQIYLNIAFALVSVGLIGTVFMELRKKNALNRLCAAAGFAWLAIFLLLTFGDYLSRTIMPF